MEGRVIYKHPNGSRVVLEYVPEADRLVIEWCFKQPAPFWELRRLGYELVEPQPVQSP